MKTIILLLATLISTPVLAQEYTEYEFVGYQKVKPDVDELTKYEQVTLHKYYSLKEGTYEYFDKFDSNKDSYDYCESTPYKTEHILSLMPSDKYENQNRILLKGPSNYLSTAVKVKNETTETLSIKDITVTIKGTQFAKVENQDDSQTLFTIPLNNPIEDIEVTVNYEASEYSYIIFTLPGTGKEKLDILLTVPDGKTSIKIHALPPESHQAFCDKYGLPSFKALYYYAYTTETYKCQNYKKEYYDTLEIDSLEGYTYDSKEDEITYKVWKRKKLDNAPSDISTPPSTTTPDLTTSVSQKPTIIAQTQGGVTPNRNQFTKIDEESIKENDKDYDRIAYNSLMGEDEDMESTCEEMNESLKILNIIKILVAILIILTILHIIQIFTVNRDD